MDHIDKDGNAPDAFSETESPEIPDDTVGYGKPPLIRRFKSGESGTVSVTLSNHSLKSTPSGAIMTPPPCSTGGGGNRPRDSQSSMNLRMAFKLPCFSPRSTSRRTPTSKAGIFLRPAEVLTVIGSFKTAATSGGVGFGFEGAPAGFPDVPFGN